MGLSLTLDCGSWLEVIVSEIEASSAEARECLARLGVLALNSATELLSSTQEVISETECRLIPAPPPMEESTSYSTTGVSMGTL